MITPIKNLLFVLHKLIDFDRDYSKVKRVLEFIYQLNMDFGIGIPEACVLLTNEVA